MPSTIIQHLCGYMCFSQQPDNRNGHLFNPPWRLELFFWCSVKPIYYPIKIHDLTSENEVLMSQLVNSSIEERIKMLLFQFSSPQCNNINNNNSKSKDNNDNVSEVIPPVRISFHGFSLLWSPLTVFWPPVVNKSPCCQFSSFSFCIDLKGRAWRGKKPHAAQGAYLNLNIHK